MIRPLAPEVRSRLRSGIATPTVAQCVEELVLNSIDAGATCVAVRVDIANYKIQVIDNGSGLNKNEMDLIGERYATSKCHDMKDLDNLSFFGYRGEALASISHISGVLEIVSKAKGSDVTYSKLFRNGKPLEVFESSKQRLSPGTTITVHSVFQNLPVRRKMLSPSLDYERIRKRIQGLAVIQPKVSITLRDDSTGSVSIQTHSTSSIANTFGRLFSQEYSKTLRKVQCSNQNFTVDGFIGTEGHFNKKLQFVYVNKRLVTKTKLHKLANILLGRSLITKRKVASDGKESQQSKDGSYSDLSSPGRSQDLYGIYVLNIDCSLSEYDITLDPGKTLVEFKNWSSILQCLEELITNFLTKENLTMKLDKPSLSSVIEEVGCSQIVDEDSQEDDLEDVAISEKVKGRLADLSDKYGRGIQTSNCSNTLTSLTVRRGAVQNSKSGGSEIQIDQIEDSNGAHEGTPEVSRNADTLLDDRSADDVQPAVDSSESSMECSDRNIRQHQQAVQSSATKAASTTGEMVMISDSVESSLKCSIVIPETPSEGSNIGTERLFTSNSSGSIVHSERGMAMDLHQNKKVNLQPQGVSECTNTRKSTPVSDVGVIEISSETASGSNSSGSGIARVEISDDNQAGTTPKRRRPYDSTEKTQSHSTPDFQSLLQTPGSINQRWNSNVDSRHVGDNVSSGDKGADNASPTDNQSAELRPGKPPEHVSEFVNDIYKTPVGYHPPAPTRKIALTHTVSSLRSFRYKKASESSLRTSARGRDEVIGEPDSSVDKSSCPYQSSLHRFRQSIKVRNTVEDKNGQSSECKSSLSSVPEANSSSATAQLSKERNITQLENTSLKDDAIGAACSVMPDQSSLHSSTALLSRERNIPQLGNTVLTKDSVSLSCSSQNTQVGRTAQTSSSAQPCTRTENDVGRFKLPFSGYHIGNQGDNKRSVSAANCSKWTETDFDRHWEDINLVRPDCSNQSMHRQKKKPNLKRLRNQFNINAENAENSRVVRTEQDHHPQKRFLTSESFLVSAQDLLGVKPPKADQEKCVLSTDVESLEQRDRRRQDTVESLGNRDRRSTNTSTIWSAIEEECININRTGTTTSSAISTAYIPHAGKTKHPQDMTRMGMDTLDREIYMADLAECNVVDQREHSHRFEKRVNRHDNDYSKSYEDEPQLIRDDKEATQAATETCSKNSAIDDRARAISANDSVLRTETSHSEKLSSMNNILEKQPSRNPLDSNRVYEKLNTCRESVQSQNTDRHSEDHIFIARSEVPFATTHIALTGDANSSRRFIPAQETQQYSSSSKDVLLESSTSNPGLGLEIGSVKENRTEEASLRTNYSTDDTSPVQDTQSFSPCSRDLLVEGSSSSACESDNNIDRNSAREICANQTSDVDQKVDNAGEQAKVDKVRQQSKSDYNRRQMEQGNTTDLTEVDPNTQRQSESGESEVVKTCDSVAKTCNPVAKTCDPDAKTCDLLAETCDPGAKTCDAVAKTDTICQISHDVEIIEDKDPNKRGGDHEGEVEEDKDLIRLSKGKLEWITQYDVKKGHTVYVNVQSGNCSLDKPNLGEHQSSEMRKDFRDGASVSSSVSACMTTTGEFHLVCLHNVLFPV